MCAARQSPQEIVAALQKTPVRCVFLGSSEIAQDSACFARPAGETSTRNRLPPKCAASPCPPDLRPTAPDHTSETRRLRCKAAQGRRPERVQVRSRRRPNSGSSPGGGRSEGQDARSSAKPAWSVRREMVSDSRSSARSRNGSNSQADRARSAKARETPGASDSQAGSRSSRIPLRWKVRSALEESNRGVHPCSTHTSSRRLRGVERRGRQIPSSLQGDRKSVV